MVIVKYFLDLFLDKSFFRSPLKSPIIMLFDPELKGNKLDIKVSHPTSALLWSYTELINLTAALKYWAFKFIATRYIQDLLTLSFPCRSSTSTPSTSETAQYLAKCLTNSIFKTSSKQDLMCCSMDRSTTIQWPSWMTNETFLRKPLETLLEARRYFQIELSCLKIWANWSTA